MCDSFKHRIRVLIRSVRRLKLETILKAKELCRLAPGEGAGRELTAIRCRLLKTFPLRFEVLRV